MKYYLHIIFLLLAFKVYGHATIIIQDVKHEKGEIDVKIYVDKESFLKEELAIETVRKKPTKGETIIPLSKVHDDQIAIVVYHDEDGNGELKTGIFWRPKEGFAFSNNYTPKGSPKFKKAAVKLVHGEPVMIKLKY
tara:strand:- start:158 stop:565 length:408 start_codon:yes stop_codon:yes gene_type:complete